MINDVVIIGGGVIGLAVADRLAGEGLRVVLLERHRCGQQASWAGAGVLTPCSWHRTDPLARMHFDSLWGYEQWTDDLRERSGIDPEYWRCGALKPLLDENRLRMARREAEVAKKRLPASGLNQGAAGFSLRGADTPAMPCPAEINWVVTLNPAEAQELEPQVATTTQFGAQWCRLTAQVRPPRLIRALEACCRRRGVDIREGTQVKGFRLQTTDYRKNTSDLFCSLKSEACGLSSVPGVVTDIGDIHACAVVVCAGAWSWEIDPLLQEHTPVYPAAGQLLLVEPPAPLIERMVAVVEDRFYAVPRRDGLLLIGSTLEPEQGYSVRPTVSGWHKLTRQALQHIPALSEAKLLHSWVGLRPGSPDRRPFIGRIPGCENLWAATGHYRTGMVLAPITAEIIAGLMLHNRCDYDLRKCAPGRNFPVQADFQYLPWRKEKLK